MRRAWRRCCTRRGPLDTLPRARPRPRAHRARRKGVTLQLLWSEYAATAGTQAYRYSQFCERYRQWVKRQKRSMRQVHRAGEKLFIDYCGPTVAVLDAAGGELRQAQVFVAVLGASSYTYAEATWTQELPQWIGSHQRAFAFFGGVVALLVPDNLRAASPRPAATTPSPTPPIWSWHAITAVPSCRRARTSPKIRPKRRWAYRWSSAGSWRGFAITPSSPWPSSTPPSRSCWWAQRAALPEAARLSRALFEQLERPALKPLPAVPYEYAEWRHAKVGVDYHVEVEQRYYSVPHRLVGRAWTCAERERRGGAAQGQARRRPSPPGPERVSTLDAHLPKAHQAHRQWSPQRFLDWAQAIGPATRAVVAHQLTDRPHPEHGYRACLGLLSHARRYGEARLEAACARALAIASPRYRSVTSILQQGLDQQPLTADEAPSTLPSHANVRGARYYH